MIKKIKYLLDNFETIKKLVEFYKDPAIKFSEKKDHKKVSIAGVPDEQREYIEQNFKIK